MCYISLWDMRLQYVSWFYMWQKWYLVMVISPKNNRITEAFSAYCSADVTWFSIVVVSEFWSVLCKTFRIFQNINVLHLPFFFDHSIYLTALKICSDVKIYLETISFKNFWEFPSVTQTCFHILEYIYMLSGCNCSTQYVRYMTSTCTYMKLWNSAVH